MNHIELFAGCGGLSLGLGQAGFKLLLANELSPMAAETFAFNNLGIDVSKEADKKVISLSSEFPRTDWTNRLKENPLKAAGLNHYSDLIEICKVVKQPDKLSSILDGSLLIGSIGDFNSILGVYHILRESIRSGFGKGSVHLVSGGPPCQSFSLAGLRDQTNERNALPWEFANFVETVNPSMAVLENVTGILRPFKVGNKKYHAWFEVAKAFAMKGFAPICLHINAKHVGVAQNRPRFVLLALSIDFANEVLLNTTCHILSGAITESLCFSESVNKNPCLSYSTKNPIIKIHDTNVSKNSKAFCSNLFESHVFRPLYEYPDASGWASVGDAIDDLRKTGIEQSDYVKKLNTIFRTNNPITNIANTEKRKNGARVRARFRLYQVLNNLSTVNRQDFLRGMRSKDGFDTDNCVLDTLLGHTLLDLHGNTIVIESRSEMHTLLEQLKTKKQTQKALIKTRPAPAALTIPDDSCHYHPDENRTLSVREMARIQSFPDWFEFRSKVTTGGKLRKYEVPQYTQVGNAVPPLLGHAIGKVCFNLLEHSLSKREKHLDTKTD